MENSFFIYTDDSENLVLERFHICTWEFKNSSLVEFGFEIEKDSIKDWDSITVSMVIPWLKKDCKMEDLYGKLKIGDNSRFIFNDSIENTEYLKVITDQQGVIHTFSVRNKLCLLPIKTRIENDRFLKIIIGLKEYQKITDEKPNVYIRFCIEPPVPFISVRKDGISKSIIIYDTKINEPRNIAKSDLPELSDKQFCEIRTCFMFNILPNSYDIIFFDGKTLKNIRTLEYEAFSKYLGDKRIQKNELLVVFNKRNQADSFSFFSVFSKERIGAGQFALAVFVNIICGVLLFIPSYRKTFDPELEYSSLTQNLPYEIWIAVFLAVATLTYFIWPYLIRPLNFLHKKR